MNKILILLIGVLIFSCNQNTKETINVKDNSILETELSSKFDWLIGKWQRNNEEEGRETFENWQKISPFEYKGIGFTMQNQDTIKQEAIKLVLLDKKWRLKVQPQEEPKPIIFNIISYSDKEFICENKEIDFPNTIKYWIKEDKLFATVSGGEMKISFEFEKINEMEVPKK